MRGALLSFTLAALLGGCSTGPAAPTVETGTMVVRPAENWAYGATPRYALAEQFQYAGNSAAPLPSSAWVTACCTGSSQGAALLPAYWNCSASA